MRGLKNMLSLLLLAAAVAVALATLFSDHSDDYGQVPLPQGGVVHLPKGEVTVFYGQPGNGSDQSTHGSGSFGFQVVPVGGGDPVPVSYNGAPSADAVQRSETIGELGAVAKLDVPSAGDYSVSGSTNLQAGSSSLKFGTTATLATIQRWRLLAGLVLVAILIALIPVSRRRRRWDAESGAPSGWSSDPRSPYVG